MKATVKNMKWLVILLVIGLVVAHVLFPFLTWTNISFNNAYIVATIRGWSAPKEKTLIYCNTFSQGNQIRPDCGKKFSSKWIPYLERFNLSDRQVYAMTEDDDKRILSKHPVFVTAFDDSHFAVAFDPMLKTFHQFFPTEKFIVYDMGLSLENIMRLSAHPSVHSIRQFNFSAYPPNMRPLGQYRWKAMVMAETLQEFEAIFFVDAHIIWQKGNMADLLEHIHCQIRGCEYYSSLLMGPTGHSIFAATDKRFYEYFPMDTEIAKRVEMGESGFFLTYYTRDVRSNVHKWFVLCSLEEDCLAPKGSLVGCTFGQNSWDYYANCHRYDQSFVNIILANRNQYNWTRYFVSFLHSRT